jgi:hypothetical protein
MNLMLQTASGCPDKYEYTLTAFATATDCSRRGNNHITIIISMNAIIQNDGLTILIYLIHVTAATPGRSTLTTQGMYVQRNIEHVRVTTVAVEK